MRCCEVRRSCAAMLAASLALVAGCTRTINMGAVREAVKDGLAKQLGVNVASVSCPDSREAKAGDVFECTATTGGGGKFTISVRQGDDKGNVNWEVAKSEGILDLRKLETAIQSGLKQQTGLDATVDCGGRYRDTEVGQSFDCKARAGNETGTVAVTMTDREGNVNWKLAAGSGPNVE